MVPTINCWNNASARNAYGTAAQWIACRLLNLFPVKINGNFDTCFDAYANDVYYEIKSVQRTGKLVIYDCRMEKELAAQSSINLQYVVCIHSLKGEWNDIIVKMLQVPITIVLLQPHIVHRLANTCALNKHKTYTAKRSGYSRAGYIDGYRNLPMQEILKLKHTTCNIPNPIGVGKITIHKVTEISATIPNASL